MKILAELGLPLPGSGIKLVPRALMNLPEDIIIQGQKEEKEYAEKGFIEKFTMRPKELLKIDETFANSNFIKEDMSHERSTGLSPSISNLKLAFKFPNLSKSLMSSNGMHMLAATPMGGFHEEKGGWSGASQFFTVNNIGTCSYDIMNVSVSNTATELAQEDVSYTINNKATVLLSPEGNEMSGYIYSLKWYDNENFHTLECANMNYSKQMNDDVIELAKKIDIS
jgi:hypothetical protein